jgi:transcriptional regulator with XRE-family HTH domain
LGTVNGIAATLGKETTRPDHVSAVTNLVSLVTMTTKRRSDPSLGLNAAVAAVLNGERVAAGMTFDQLADVSGISKQQLMRLLSTTQRHIDVEVLGLLADIFQTTSAEIVVAAQRRMDRPARETEEDLARRLAREALANQTSRRSQPARQHGDNARNQSNSA